MSHCPKPPHRGSHRHTAPLGLLIVDDRIPPAAPGATDIPPLPGLGSVETPNLGAPKTHYRIPWPLKTGGPFIGFDPKRMAGDGAGACGSTCREIAAPQTISGQTMIFIGARNDGPGAVPC